MGYKVNLDSVILDISKAAGALESLNIRPEKLRV
jgi:hypothetical protein